MRLFYKVAIPINLYNVIYIWFIGRLNEIRNSCEIVTTRAHVLKNKGPLGSEGEYICKIKIGLYFLNVQSLTDFHRNYVKRLWSLINPISRATNSPKRKAVSREFVALMALTLLTCHGSLREETQTQSCTDGVWRERGQQEIDQLPSIRFYEVLTLFLIMLRQMITDFLQKVLYNLLKQDGTNGKLPRSV